MRFKVAFVGLAVSLGLVGLAHAQSGAKEPAFTFGAEYQPTYMKFKEDGETTLKGWINAGKFYAKIRPAGAFLIEPSFKIYGGDLKFDDAKLDMNGWDAEVKLGYSFCAGSAKVTPYISLGREYMSLDSSYESKKTYGKIGVAPVFGTGNYYLYGDLYMRYPFSLKYEEKNGEESYKPKKKLGYGAELGVGVNNFIKKGLKANVGLFYEYDKYGKRTDEDSDIKRYLYGVRAGLSF